MIDQNEVINSIMIIKSFNVDIVKSIKKLQNFRQAINK